MRKEPFWLALVLLFSASCSSLTPTPTEEPLPSSQAEAIPSPTPVIEEGRPPVTGPDPSTRIAAFYYPWYFNPEFDGSWDHWGRNPPGDISSDYFPVLGTYSMSDKDVLAQHFAWMRQAGIGLIISSWWGQNDPTDQAMPLLLDVADVYGIKIAFHIEPYHGRSAEQLILDIDYIFDNYGDHPAFYWTTQTSCFSTNDQPKGLFFLWASVVPQSNDDSVPPEYWQEVIDTLHNRDPGVIILTDQPAANWVLGGHFDGAYKYVVLAIDEEGQDWAADMPSCAWYVPGINPGFSAVRIGYVDDVNTPRQDGDTYDDRWERMFDVGIEPEIVAISTFNEWHEGTQIEPAAPGMTRPNGEPYLDYNPMDPEAYLDMTAEWAEIFLDYEWPEGTNLRLRVRTTSDWTTIDLTSGASWRAPVVISASEEAASAGMIGGHVALDQPIDLAQSGNQVEVILEIEILESDAQEAVVFSINRGHLGATWIELYRFMDQEWVMVDSFVWSGINSGYSNAVNFSIEYATIFGAD